MEIFSWMDEQCNRLFIVFPRNAVMYVTCSVMSGQVSYGSLVSAVGRKVFLVCGLLYKQNRL